MSQARRRQGCKRTREESAGADQVAERPVAEEQLAVPLVVEQETPPWEFFSTLLGVLDAPLPTTSLKWHGNGTFSRSLLSSVRCAQCVCGTLWGCQRCCVRGSFFLFLFVLERRPHCHRASSACVCVNILLSCFRLLLCRLLLLCDGGLHGEGSVAGV